MHHVSVEPMMSAEPALGASPELLLVLRCARLQPSPDELAALSALVRSPLNWPRVLRLAAWHRMVPLVHWRLKALGWTGVPSAIVEELTDAFLSNAALSLQRASTLLDLLAALGREGIAALPYKGPAMAAQLYGNVALRQAGDIDILVSRSHAVRARELLLGLGYSPRHPIAPNAVDFMIRSRYHETLEHPERPTVEVHWSFTNADISFPVGLEDLLANARDVQLGGRIVRVFGDDDQLLILAVHGAKHRWGRIEWLCSFAELVRRADGLDWERLVARARALGVERRLLLGLHLASDVLDAPVPEWVEEAARRTPHLAALAAEIQEELWEHAQFSSVAEREASIPKDWFQLRVSDGWRERLRLIAYRATTPTQPEDWSPVTVGHVLFPAHAFLRPFQVSARLIPAIWWYITQRRVVRETVRREV